MPLTDEQRDELARRLDERERFLRQDVGREVEGSEDYRQVSGEAPDAGDQSTADLVVDLGHAEIGRDLAELREIAAARERMAGGDYGVCQDCGIDIPYERLLAQPTALRCTPCQARYEQTHAARRGPTL